MAQWSSARFRTIMEVVLFQDKNAPPFLGVTSVIQLGRRLNLFFETKVGVTSVIYLGGLKVELVRRSFS
jgi:hypothetical protein